MTGIESIAAERQRQIEVEGFAPEKDAEYVHGELVDAARCYLMAAFFERVFGRPPNLQELGELGFWPWDSSWWKPEGGRVRNLEKAGALIAAEIDRLQSDPVIP